MATPRPGTVEIPYPSRKGDTITLHQENTYFGIKFYIGTGWDTYLDGSYEIWFTGKERFTQLNADNLFDVQCTVDDAVNGIISADMDASDTDITPGPNYRWQLQVKKTDNSEVKVVLNGKLVIEPTLLGIEP
jgi:hypothetical protein